MTERLASRRQRAQVGVAVSIQQYHKNLRKEGICLHSFSSGWLRNSSPLESCTTHVSASQSSMREVHPSTSQLPESQAPHFRLARGARRTYGGRDGGRGLGLPLFRTTLRTESVVDRSAFGRPVCPIARKWVPAVAHQNVAASDISPEHSLSRAASMMTRMKIDGIRFRRIWESTSFTTHKRGTRVSESAGAVGWTIALSRTRGGRTCDFRPTPIYLGRPRTAFGWILTEPHFDGSCG